MKTLTQFAEEIYKHKNNPSVLAELHIELATKFAYLSEIMKDLQIKKAMFWQIKFEPEKPLSDTYIEAKWRVEEEGQKELKLKYEMKALEKLMSAIKSSIVVNSLEAKNLT
jgi:hypothetical protein